MSSIREKLNLLKNNPLSPERLEQQRQNQRTIFFLIFCAAMGIIFNFIAIIFRPDKFTLAFIASAFIACVFIAGILHIHFNLKGR